MWWSCWRLEGGGRGGGGYCERVAGHDVEVGLVLVLDQPAQGAFQLRGEVALGVRLRCGPCPSVTPSPQPAAAAGLGLPLAREGNCN